MKTIAFYNVKGGVAKTTSTINVAYDLAKLGYKTLVVDLDPQSNTSDFFERCNEDKPTVAELLCNPSYDTETVVQNTDFDGLDIIPAYLSLGRAEKFLISDTTTPQQLRLRHHLKNIAPYYDYCVLDCSPAAEAIVNINGLAAADAVFVPLRCDKWAVAGLVNTLEVTEAVRTYNDNLFFGGAFFSQYEKRNIDRAVAEELKTQLGNKLLSEHIRKCAQVPLSSHSGKPLSCFAAWSTCAKDYEALTERIVKIVG
ncbi:MAG: AAA family ATPase [Clostridia bacterium]|nr:AAA family ATPase [Clostridia bacterium]